jgi:hypothetical protein
MPFRNTLALWSLAFLIPLIIFYLFSRRPKKLVFSSLMFFVKDNEIKKRTAFLRRILANLLLFLQFGAIALLGFSSATPVLKMPGNQTEEQVVIILDSSASMQAVYGGSTRFDEAVKRAEDIVKDKKKVSLILAENIPITLLDKGSSERAVELLKNVRPSETASNLEDAMFQAMALSEGGVYILSDFASQKEPVIAKKQLSSKGMAVHYEVFNEPVSNIGIIDVGVAENVRLKVKNFNSEAVKFSIKSNSSSKEVVIEPEGIKEVYFDIAPGKNEFVLDIRDGFAPDNFAFVSLPEKKRINTLYITNNEGKDFLKAALESTNKLEIKTTILPVIPLEENYQLYIVKDIDKGKLLPSAFYDLLKKAELGSSVVINAQPDSGSIDYKKLELINIDGKEGRTKLIKNINNKATSDIEFGEAPEYFITSGENCERWVVAESNETVVCNKKAGEGNVLFFGILESADFKSTPEYPLFWSYLIDYYFPQEEDYELNFKSGAVLPVAFQEIETPEGVISSNKAVLNKIGFYTLDNVSIGVNLEDFAESNINTKAQVESGIRLGGSVSSKSAEKDISKELAFIALVVVFIELVIIKWRGDL